MRLLPSHLVRHLCCLVFFNLYLEKRFSNGIFYRLRHITTGSVSHIPDIIVGVPVGRASLLYRATGSVETFLLLVHLVRHAGQLFRVCGLIHLDNVGQRLGGLRHRLFCFSFGQKTLLMQFRRVEVFHV